MTIQKQIDQLKKELSAFIGNTNKKIAELEVERIKVTNHTKPTRYYPNGAYMDEPEEGAIYWYSWGYSVFSAYYGQQKFDEVYFKNMSCFPTEGACLKSIRHDDLIAKMYRDMRDERIIGDWVADWKDESQDKYFPKMFAGALDIDCTHYLIRSRDFFYKKCTFIEDLKKFLNWTEEELKIVWFRV